jgi:FtsP/CotA-like multicopper oxidase with cupredoxin domain
MPHQRFSLTRRRAIGGIAVTLTALALPGAAFGQAPAPTNDGFRILRASKGALRLRGEAKAETPIWGYDGLVPGPTLRLKRGEELKVRLLNDLPEPTLIHWHGLRLPNAMDGVPHLTQDPVEPGKSFDYRFTVPDAGTFWYHSHLYSSEQLERGLYGPLIVDEPQPVDVDRDLVLVLDDWRLAEDGTIHEASFRSFHDAAHAGRHGRLLTLNSQDNPNIPVRANERLRLRFINAANARVFPLRIDGHSAWVMAVDGQPAEPFPVRDSRITLGPGSRVDLFVDAAAAPGTTASILSDAGNGDEVVLARLSYEPATTARPEPRAAPQPLPPNPLPAKIDFKSAFRLDVPLEGGAMSPMMMGRMMMGRMQGGSEVPGHGIDPSARLWTMGGFASSGHHGPALFSVKRGQPVMLAFQNNTAFPHAMHLHGHHFRLLDNLDDGWKPFWLDTVMLNPRQTARIAFVADNPGKWMIHCHMLEHQETGMAAWFEVT